MAGIARKGAIIVVAIIAVGIAMGLFSGTPSGSPDARGASASTLTLRDTSGLDLLYYNGDINGDGVADSLDGLVVLQYLAALMTKATLHVLFGAENVLRADVNLDGALTAVDVLLILQFDARLLVSLPAGPEGKVPPPPATPTPTATPTATPTPTTTPMQVSFSDPTGDAVNCATGEPADDPFVDMSGLVVSLLLTGLSARTAHQIGTFNEAFEDAASAAVRANAGGQTGGSAGGQTVAGAAGQTGLAENHGGTMTLGFLDDQGNVIPGTEENVIVGPTGVTFIFPEPLQSGETLLIETFHQETAGGPVNCDTMEVVLP